MNQRAEQPRKGLTRSLDRRGTRADKSPPVALKTRTPKEPGVCEKCSAMFMRKTWRRDRKPTIAILDKATWTICPACEQVADDRYFGRVVISGGGVTGQLDAIERRIANVARRASVTQPERRLVSEEWNGKTLEVLTTSQKLAHRIVHELKKAFGGKARYNWSDEDGSLLATWQLGTSR